MPYLPDTPPAKLWELLRRNSQFQRTVKLLLSLESVRQGGDPKKWDRSTGRAGRVLSCVGRHNPCAETALRWLAFPPLFVRRVIACEAGRKKDLKVGRSVPLETVRLGWGAQPRTSRTHPWIWFSSARRSAGVRLDSAESKANAHGWPNCLGPEIETVSSRDPRLRPCCRDEIAEWTAHFSDGRCFTLDTPWPETPVGFRRTFSAQWSGLCGKGQVAETHFFCDWNLATLVARASKSVNAANRLVRDLVGDLDRVRRASSGGPGPVYRDYVGDFDRVRLGKAETVCPPVPTRGGNSMRNVPQVELTLTKAETERLFMFGELARKRIFALPNLLTREDVEPVLAELKRQLLQDLPDTHELLGTAEFWKDFVAVDSIARTKAIEVGDAIRRHIYRSPEMMLALKTDSGLPPAVVDRHFKMGVLIEPGAQATTAQRKEWATVRSRIGGILRTVNQRERPTIKLRVEFMNLLAGAAFPRMDLAALLAKPQHKRPRKP